MKKSEIFGEQDYEDVVDTLRRLNITFDDASSLLLHQYKHDNQFGIIERVIALEKREKVSIVKKYLEEKEGFEKDSYTFDGTECIEGVIPHAFRMKSEVTYGVAIPILGKIRKQTFSYPRVQIKTKGKEGVINCDFARLERNASPITDKAKAVEVLETLARYVIA